MHLSLTEALSEGWMSWLAAILLTCSAVESLTDGVNNKSVFLGSVASSAAADSFYTLE